jgi:hypothetical protein
VVGLVVFCRDELGLEAVLRPAGLPFLCASAFIANGIIIDAATNKVTLCIFFIIFIIVLRKLQ